MEMGKTFDDLMALGAHFPELDSCAMEHFDRLSRSLPEGCMGAVAGLAPALRRFASIQGAGTPRTGKPVLCLFAASHGFAPDTAAAAAEIEALSKDGRPLTRLCGAVGAGLRVLDLAVSVPTADMRIAEAMTERDVAATIAFGMEATAAGGDILGLGALAEGGILAARMVARGLLRLSEAETLEHCSAMEREAARKAYDCHGDRGGAALALIAAYGGRELAALTGAIVAARVQRLPVVADGIVAGIAAAIAAQLLPGGANHVAHCALPPSALSRAIVAATGAPEILPGGGGAGRGEGAAFSFGLLKNGASLLAD